MRAAQKNLAVVGKGVMIGGAAIAAGGAAALAATVGAVTKAGELQAQMSNVGTLLNGNTAEVNARLYEMQGQLLSVSNVTGMMTADLTGGLYQVVSAFGDSADAAKQLEIAAIAAKAGNASTTDSINLLSAVTKGYNDTSIAAMQKASDLAFQTVKLGQTSYPELAASIGTVIPVAQAMKGSQEDLFGAMATLTGVTGGTAEVTTQLRGVYQGFLQPTAGMAKAMQSLGYADGQVMMESLGLQGTLEALKGSVGGNELAFANLFGSIEAKNAVLALTGAQAEDLTKKTQAMYQSTGLTDKAFATQMNNFPAMWDKFKNYGVNAFAMFGTAILPPLMTIAEKAMPMVENAMLKLPGVIEKITPVVGRVFGFIGDKVAFLKQGFQIIAPIVKKVFAGFSEGEEKLKDFVPILKPSIGQMMAFSARLMEIGKVVAPIAQKMFAVFKSGGTALAKFAQTLLPKLGEMIHIIATKAFPALVSVFQKAAPIVAPIVQTVGVFVDKLAQMVNAVLPPFISGLQVVGTVLVGAFSPFMPIISDAMGALNGLMDFVTGVFTGNWTLACNGLRDAFGNAFSALFGLIKLPLNQVIGAINGVFSSIGSFTVPDWVMGIGGQSITLPQIPMLYTGVRNFPGGTALVGERGPELVNFPRGVDVYNNRETGGILSRLLDFGDFGGFGGITINAPITMNGPITQEQAQQAGTMLERTIEQAVRAALARIKREERRTAFVG